MAHEIDDLAWMRNPQERSRLLEHLRAESECAKTTLTSLGPLRLRLREEALSRTPHSEDGPHRSIGGSSWWLRQQRGNEFPTLWRRSPDGEEITVLDLNHLADGSPYCRLAYWEVSPTGLHIAYALDILGDESYQLRIKDVVTGKESVADGRGIYYGGTWNTSSSAFYYVRHDTSFRPFQVWRHKLGVPFEHDQLLLHEEDPRFHLTTRRTNNHLVINASSRLTTQEWLVELEEESELPEAVTERREGLTYCATPTNLGGESRLLIVTNFEAVESRLMTATGPGSIPEAWKEVVPHDPGVRMYLASVLGDRVLIECRRGGFPRLLSFTWGNPADVVEFGTSAVDGTMRVSSFDSGNADAVAVEIESYLEPMRIESIDLSRGDRTVEWRRDAPQYERSRYTSERRAIVARDGTAIPITIVRALSTPLDGTAPCLLYGYGAWEAVIEPAFDPMLISLLDRGVVYIHAHLRGGGEMGRAWWLDGRMDKKINTFTDFIDVGEELGRSVVDSQRIVILGRSAGGLLMGSVYSLRPDLWRGVIAEAPFVDPITTMLDESAPLVAVEWDEWGDPRRPEDHAWMMSWSPIDNIPPLLRRPSLLVTSSQYDSRVSTWEPARWVQRLRGSGSNETNVVFDASVEPGAHAVPEGVNKGLDYLSSRFSWALGQLGLTG